MTKKSENDFRERMKLYPSHFDLDIRFGSTTVNRRNIIGKLCDQMTTTGFDLDIELTRTFNFLSYIHWRLNEYQKAKDYVNEALSKRQDDVMALANQAWMHWRRDEKFEAESIVDKLEKIKDRHDLIIIAKGEQAFAYSRFGPKYYKKAIDLYTDVIAAAAGCEIEETHIQLWQFGLGLILKRQLHIVNAFNYDHVSKYVRSMNDAFVALYYVATKAKTTRIKARSWVAIGELSYSVHNNHMLSPEEKESLPKEITDKKPDEFFDRACEICDDDVYVLERCGKHARYSKDYSKSIKFLTRSVKTRETSFGFHHLAKTLISVLNTEISKASNRSADVRSSSQSRQFHNIVWEEESAKRKLFLETGENSTSRNKCNLGDGKALVNERSTISRNQAEKETSNCFSESDLKHFPNLSISDTNSSFCHEIKKDREPLLQDVNKYIAETMRSSGDQGRIVEKYCADSTIAYNQLSMDEHKESGYETEGVDNSKSHSGAHNNYSISMCDRKVAEKAHGRTQDPAFPGSFISQQHKVQTFMRSPRKVLTYSQNDQRVTEILHYLDKAIQCSPANCGAWYDKGLVLRFLGRLEKAVELFTEIRSKKECSQLQAVLCLEQQALCQQRLAELETQPIKMEALNDNVKHLLFKAIETAADIAAHVPHFQPRGTAFPSLREMLVIQRQSKKFQKTTTLKEFATLYQLVGEHGKALPFWKEIFEMSEEAAKDSKIILPLAQSYVKQKDFRNGLLLFNLMEASCARLANEDRNLYIQAYLEGAIYALEQGDVEEATARFKRTIRFCSRRRYLSEDDGEDCTYDMHIQTSENAEENGWSLYNIFTRECGLKVSLNDNQTTEELKYDVIFEGVNDIMEQSSLIVLLLDTANLKHRAFRYFMNMAVRVNVDDDIGTGIISICLGDLKVPGEIEQFPVFLQPPDLDLSKLNKEEKHQWLKDFFWKAAKQPSPSKKPNETEQTDSD